MTAFKDLSGQKFNRLTVIKRSGKDKQGNALWECLCDCGNHSTVRSFSLKDGGVKSCGCLHNEVITKHGMSRHKGYSAWSSMKQRCHNPSDPDYHKYGGRGISVCYRWRYSFAFFIEDMGNRPYGMSIDRIDNDKGYSPENCKWATAKEQANNMRTNRRITHNGITKTITDWSYHLGGSKCLVSLRLHKGWSEERAVTTKMIERYSHKVKHL